MYPVKIINGTFTNRVTEVSMCASCGCKSKKKVTKKKVAKKVAKKKKR